MNTVSTYSQAMQFATKIFHYLNGKVNYMVPASCLLFGNSSMKEKCLGDTTLDIVEINIPNIFHLYAGEKYYEDSIKGAIIYTLIHELLHLDQDFEAYERLSNDKELVTNMIEQSCHAFSLRVFNDLCFTLSRDLNEEFFIVPTSDVFMNIPIDDYQQYKAWENSYYRVSSYEQKAVFSLNSYFDIDFPAGLYHTQSMNVLLELSWNGTSIGTQYIYYLNHWIPINIFNLLRYIGYIKKVYPSNSLELDIKAYTLVNQDDPLTSIDKYTINVLSDLKLEVINEIPIMS